MADAAHLTSATTNEKPSIFEVLAQESLISTIRPAIKHAIRVLAEHRPDRYSWLLRYYDEIYTGLDFLLEYYYLQKHCASFAENFYSLRRVAENVEPGRRLPKSAFWKSIICIVILPYVKQKLDEKFEDLRHVYNTYSGNRGMSGLSRAFVAIYPYVHTAWEGAILGYQTAYMFSKSDWHSPFLRLSGVTLCMETEDQSNSTLSSSSSMLSWNQLSFAGKLSFILRKVFKLTAVTLSTSLSVGMFFIQFLDWWYANDSASTSLTSLPVPDPPQRESSAGRIHHGVCPVCHKTRSNDTALSVSGYVFCYPCVYDYVKEYKRCPVTNYPARTEHLIKLYISDS